jgi:hypothetical protein
MNQLFIKVNSQLNVLRLNNVLYFFTNCIFLTGTRLELFETGDIKIIIYRGVLKIYFKRGMNIFSFVKKV